MAMKSVLTIAGHDLSHGAGITKDLDIFSSLGLHGISIPTSLVVQGPHGATSLNPVPLPVFSEMLERVSADFSVRGIKVGVVADAGHVERIAKFAAARKDVPLVLDPVISAKNGLRLMTDKALTVLIDRLLPLVRCVTPNLDEAAALLGRPIAGRKGMEQAARDIARLGPHNVVLKGGHLKGTPVDLLFDGKSCTTSTRKRIGKTVHGTGCMFSSALLSFLVLGYPVREAFLETEKLMDTLLGESCRVGEGEYFYAFPGVIKSREAEKWEALRAMCDAAVRLRELNMVELIPEVQMNLGYALREARDVGDVVAFPGRIGHKGGKVWMKGMPEFGASSHVARLCLTYMRHYPYVRACVNIRYDEATVERAGKKGLSVRLCVREKEPKRVRNEEGKSLDFLVEGVLKRTTEPPDIIYDRGDIGKEPMIRLFARDPYELIRKMEMVRPWTTN